MLMLLVAVTTWAQTELPQITTDLENPIYYTIYNTRSQQPGGLMYYAGDGVGIKDGCTSAVLEDKYKFYFTGSHDALYVHNAATTNKLASVSSWTTDGIVWCVKQREDGYLAFGPQGAADGAEAWWNDKNYSTDAAVSDFTVWYSDDAGSGFVVELASEFTYPEVGKFYTIEAPLFEKVQGVAKGLVATGGNALGWNTVDLANKNYYWTLVKDDETDALYLKNVGTGYYINGDAVRENAAALTTNALGSNQFNIITNGTKLHAAGHDSGKAANGGVTGWDGAANSASAWKFVEREDPDANVIVNVVYNFKYQGVDKGSQATEVVAGYAYPAISKVFPFGVNAEVPIGTVNAEDAEEVEGVKTITKEIELTISLPFIYYSNYSDVKTWYYVNLRDDSPTYMYYDSSISYIKATQTTVPADAKDAYSWAFIGDPFNGFKVVNLLAGETMVLSSPVVPTTEQNAEQIARMVTEVDATGNTTWNFVKPTHGSAAANGFYIQHPTAESYAINRQGYNGAYTLCYWTGRDTGSVFQVAERPSVQAELEALIATAETKYQNMQTLNSDAVGHYSDEVLATFKAAIDVAKEITVAEESDVETLQAAIDAIYTNAPATGSFIAFKSAASGDGRDYCAGKYVKTVPVVTNYSGAGYAADRDHTQLVFDTHEPATTPSAVFEVVAGVNPGEFKLKNAHTQEFVISFVKGAQHMGTEANAVAITLDPLGEDQFAVYGANNDKPMHAQEAHNVIVTWDAELNNCSAWNIVEVENFAHQLTVGEAGYATLMLGFNAIIPSNVEVYVANGTVEGNENYVNLEPVTGILPAGTAVVVVANKGTYDFAYTSESAEVANNDLEGTLYDANVAKNAYVLGQVDGVVGLYKATLNQAENTAFKNNANKAYLVVPGASEVASYSFRFGEGTTGVEKVEIRNEKSEIYDLTGRKIENVTAPGIYVVNGKKVLVK